MSNAAHISSLNAPSTLPHSPALRGCNHCVVTDAFTSSLHVGQQGDSALWMPSVGWHEETFDDAINEALVSVVSPLLVRSHAVGLFMRPITPHAGTTILRHIAALLSGLLSQSKFGPLLQNARLGLGSRASRSGFANG